MADASFKAAIAFYKPVAKLTHTQTVQRLYRRWVHGSPVDARLCLPIQRVLFSDTSMLS